MKLIKSSLLKRRITVGRCWSSNSNSAESVRRPKKALKSRFQTKFLRYVRRVERKMIPEFPIIPNMWRE